MTFTWSGDGRIMKPKERCTEVVFEFDPAIKQDFTLRVHAQDEDNLEATGSTRVHLFEEEVPEPPVPHGPPHGPIRPQ
jgi:hypothetical protein